MGNSNGHHFETLAVHAGVAPDPTTGSIMTPIYATSTYAQQAPNQHKGYEYSRLANPTRTALENALAALEGGKYGFALASGVAGIDTLMHLLSPGDEVICCDDVYGGTSRLFRTVWANHGIEFRFVDMTRESVADYATSKTKMIWVETPTNPLLKVIDLARIGEWVKTQNPRPLFAVDNTFASPYFQNPLALGAHVVLHSTTKYLNGHSDVIGGALVTNQRDLKERLQHILKSAGAIAGPFDSFLVLRGIKTLALRMERHAQNAVAVATFLSHHGEVERVLYPGLASHPQHEVAKAQMRGFGGMITFDVKGNQARAHAVLQHLKLFTLAESLGGVESLAEHPASMTHAAILPETRKALGIHDSTIRLSVGIESSHDLIRDLEVALAETR